MNIIAQAQAIVCCENKNASEIIGIKRYCAKTETLVVVTTMEPYQLSNRYACFWLQTKQKKNHIEKNRFFYYYHSSTQPTTGSITGSKRLNCARSKRLQ